MDKALGVNDPRQGLVDGRDEWWKGLKVWLFNEEGGIRAHAEGSFDLPVGHLDGPLGGFEIELMPIIEGSAGKEVALYIGENALNAGLSIGVTHAMGDEAEAENPGEGLHLRCDFGVGSGAAGDNDAGVVDSAVCADSAHEAEGLGQEVAGFEAGKYGVVLDEGLSAVGENEGGALGEGWLASQEEAMGRGVKLHLLSRLEGIRADPFLGAVLEVGLAHQASEGAVGNVLAVTLEQELFEPDDVSLACGKERRGQGEDLFSACGPGPPCGWLSSQNGPYGVFRDFKDRADLADRGLPLAEGKDCIACLLRDHDLPPFLEVELNRLWFCRPSSGPGDGGRP